MYRNENSALTRSRGDYDLYGHLCNEEYYWNFFFCWKLSFNVGGFCDLSSALQDQGSIQGKNNGNTVYLFFFKF